MTGAEAFGVNLEEEHLHRFALHAEELLKWNRKINITAITDPAAVAVKHFLDSLAPARLIPRGAVVLDVGSGGGFPGIPLKVLGPGLHVRLVDASGKRVSFMKQVIRKLGLSHIDALHERAERLCQNDAFFHAFDVIVSRAFSDLSAFVALSLPLLKRDGAIVAFKGKPDPQEMADAKQSIQATPCNRMGFHGPLDFEIKTYTLPFLNLERALIVIKAAESGTNRWGPGSTA